jgi:hypothetical protein
MRDFLCSFAMMISSQLAPGILTELKSILRPGRNGNPSSARKVWFAVSYSARRSFWLDAQLVIDGVHDPLPGAQILLCGLDRSMPEQKLDLLKLSTG